MGTSEGELPLLQLKKGKSHTTDNPETIAKVKKTEAQKGNWTINGH